MARSPEVGSRPVLWALFSPHHVVHGRWCANCQVEEESDFALSQEGKEVQGRVWVMSFFFGFLVREVKSQ